MGIQQISDATISFNWQEVNLLRKLVEKEKEACRVSLRAVGHWTKRLEKHVTLLLSVAEKLEGA